MIVKVEVYYELTRESKKPFPENSKVVLAKKLMDESPKTINLSGNWFDGYDVIATKLSESDILERIRTHNVKK